MLTASTNQPVHQLELQSLPLNSRYNCYFDQVDDFDYRFGIIVHLLLLTPICLLFLVLFAFKDWN